MNKKQDINMSRKPIDLEIKYKLTEINPTIEEVETLKNKVVVDSVLSTTSTHPVENRVITKNLNNKVSKEPGKGLSTNDFTNEYKDAIGTATTSSHTHSNKDILDGITTDNINNWNLGVPFSLFENSSGSTDNITLNETSANYRCIDIVFGNSSSIYDTKRIYNPDGKNIALSIASNSTTSIAVRTENDSISGTTITRGARNKFAIDSTGTVTIVTSENITDADKLLIYKVIGYK